MKSSKFILAAMYFLLLLVLPIGRGYGESHVMKNNSSYPEDSLVIRNQFGAPIIDAEGRRINYTYEELRIQEQEWRLRQSLNTNTGRGGYSMPQTTVSPASGSAASWSYGAFGDKLGYSSTILDIVNGHPEIYKSVYAKDHQYFWYTLRYNNVSKAYEQSFVSNVFSSLYGGSISALEVADVTGDSRKEIVIAVFSGKIYLYDQATKEFIKDFTLDIAPSQWVTDLEIADADGDMKNDYIISATDKLILISAEGNRLWEQEKCGYYLCVGQMDDDIALEIVVIDYYSGYVIDGSSGNIQWNWSQGVSAIIDVVDIDYDGKDELISVDRYSNTITAYDVDSQLVKWTTATSNNYSGMTFLDIDNDSVAEIFLGKNSLGCIYAYDSVTFEQKRFVMNPDGRITRIGVGDSDNDGNTELIWMSGQGSSGGECFFVADWQTSQIEWQSIHLDGPFAGPEIGDLDGDGKKEIVAVSHESESGFSSGRIVVFDTNGNLKAISPAEGYSSGSINALKLFDVDRDGKQEIIVAGESGGAYIFIYDFNVDNTFTLNWSKSPTPYSNRFQSVTAGDIDNDGQIEIVGGLRDTSGASTAGRYLYAYDYISGNEEWHSIGPSETYRKISNIEIWDIDNDGSMEVISHANEENIYVYKGKTGELKNVLFGPYTAMTVIDTNLASQALALGTPNGNIELYNCDGGVYRKIFDQNFVDTPIDAISTISTNEELIFSTNGTLKIGQDNGIIKWTSANYGKPYGKKVVLHPERSLIYSAGAYSINAFDYTPDASTPSIRYVSPNGGELLNAGTSYLISWFSVGAVGDVMIEYSIDNGNTWSTITGSTTNDGNYSWTVPDTPSEKCLVRISDVAGSVQGQSHNTFGIVGLPGITVISPNGGENWEGNSTHQITWSYKENIVNVKLEYSIDGGNTWSIISSSIPNTGSFNWTVPNTPNSNSFVRVSDAEGSDVDKGDSAFTIAPERTITVTSPNGGESWEGNSTHPITWSSTGNIDIVKVEYTADNGNTWSSISDSIPNTGSYNWTVPITASSNCFVRVSDVNGDVIDQGDSPFTVFLKKTITVTSPNGGESWKAYSIQKITWNHTGDITDVGLSYSTNNGSSWNTIIGSTPNTGSYDWKVPDIPSTQCLVRVRDVNSQAVGWSNSTFTIIGNPYIYVSSPKRGVTWKKGENCTITWETIYMTGNVKIELYKNGEFTYSIGTAPAEDGTMTWRVPEEIAVGNDYKVRVYQAQCEAFSIGDFYITGYQPYADFNGDGKTDILWRYTGSPSIYGNNMVWLLDGVTQVGRNWWLDPEEDQNWEIVGTADFNDDYKTDILWRYYGTGNMAGRNRVWYMDGTTKIGEAYLQRVIDVNWRIEGTGDFNNDGKTDIMWRYYGSPSEGINMIWLMDGVTKIGGNNWIQRVIDVGWKMVGSGDFNNDGKCDILWRYYSSPSEGINMIWHMDGLTKIGKNVWLPRQADLDWDIGGTGDFNGDGKTDILWRKYGKEIGKGTNIVWYMDGITRLGNPGYLPLLGNVFFRIVN